MPAKVFTIQNAKIGFRNFSGVAGKFNPPGIRNFCIFPEIEFAKTLEADGWNVKWLPQHEDDDAPQAYLPVEVSFRNEDQFPVRIVQVTRGGKTLLNEKSISTLDAAAITNVDLTINGSRWSVNEKTGIKAYLKTLFITLVEDELEAKYADYPDRPDSAYNAPPSKDNGN